MSASAGRPAARFGADPGDAAPATVVRRDTNDPLGGAAAVFVVGCARSGTTWLQLLLSQHPSVATSQETHLFSRYLSELERGWRFEHDASIDRRRNTGLAAVLDEDDFYRLCRSFASEVLGRVLATRPGATVVLEKTPSHVHHAALIRRVFPNARFLHLVRDPRSVAASLIGAGRSWGGHWAPTSAPAAARMWRRDVRAGRGIAALTDRYRELRYEELVGDGERSLADLLRWLELPFDPDFPRQALEACDIDRLRTGDERVSSPWSLEREPAGFYRRGSVDGWRQELSRSDIAAIEYVAAPLMRELGYEASAHAAVRKPVLLAARDALRWRLERIQARLGRWVGQL